MLQSNNKMVNTCREICVRYKAVGYEGHHKYENGQKMCPVCQVFLTYPGFRCPCCSVKLRTSPRGNRARKEIHEKRNCVWH